MDARANSPEKIAPPYPLPYVSRRALKVIGDDAITPPTHCRYCEAPVSLVRHAEIYGGREFGDWPFAYLCRKCKSYVGVHKNTDIPLGTLANAELRRARKSCKDIFMEMLDRLGLKRKEAYKWLAAELGIPKKECHWGMFEVDRCIDAGRLCRGVISAEQLKRIAS